MANQSVALACGNLSGIQERQRPLLYRIVREDKIDNECQAPGIKVGKQ